MQQVKTSSSASCLSLLYVVNAGCLPAERRFLLIEDMVVKREEIAGSFSKNQC